MSRAEPAGPVRPGREAADDAAEAHARFARAGLLIYVGAAAVAVLILVASITADRAYQESQLRRTLVLEIQLRAEHLSQQLGLLQDELKRLGSRSEIDLLDRDPGPERDLLQRSHENSAFFNVGVAVVGPEGDVVWSEPPTFLPVERSVSASTWFRAARSGGAVQVVPVDPDRVEDAILYVVSPITRSGRFLGALLGAIDLARGREAGTDFATTEGRGIVLATRRGAVVYPPRPPSFALEPAWLGLFEGGPRASFVADAVLGGKATVIAATTVPDTDLVILTLAGRASLLGSAAARMRTRLLVGVTVVLIPLVLLVGLFAKSLRSFRRATDAAHREERLRLLGEASSLIAHEVKNLLNGLRIGLDLLLRSERPGRSEADARIVGELRNQIERMSEFTTELLTFSKGILPRPADVELAGFVGDVVGIAAERASEIGVDLRFERCEAPVPVRADPSLVHVVVSNLVENALEAVSAGGAGPRPRIEVAVGTADGRAFVRVSDNGPGVPARIREELFEPFVSGKPSGVGIGLALARRIARAHGGDLVLERSGPGAAFLLTIPGEAA